MPTQEETAALARKVFALVASFTFPLAIQASDFHTPSRYFSYQNQETAGAEWTPTDPYQVCLSASASGKPPTPAHAARIIALSGAHRVIRCYSEDIATARTHIAAAIEAFNTDEMASAKAARSAMDGGIPNFSTDAMLMNILKYAAEPFNEQAWLSATRDEIIRAQYADKSASTSGKKIVFDWVFPPESLRDRNPDISAQELLPRFKTEALRRAKGVQDTFVMRSVVGNVKYDLGSGVLIFGNGKTADSPIVFKPPMNVKFNGHTVYAVNGANDGISKYTDDAPLTVVGFRNIVAAGHHPGLVTDRTLLAKAIRMPQDQAEKLLNKTNMLVVNVVMTITGAERLKNKNGLALSPSNGILFARVDKMFVTDMTGMPLTTYAVEALPANNAATAQHKKTINRAPN
ncbi:hypothetical protein [Pusillimonas sp. T2]|uniref:hypothetical protein n=1 Tax=Pusillimonas sp. T2 TaxID=1548123 RepID=UPI00117B4BA7|nr:hypothetical protein [Pusillimonas sp. T2]